MHIRGRWGTSRCCNIPPPPPFLSPCTEKFSHSIIIAFPFVVIVDQTCRDSVSYVHRFLILHMYTLCSIL